MAAEISRAFTIRRCSVDDAETMAAILYDYALHPELRDAVKTEFTRIQGLFGEYQSALQKAYPKPEIAEPK